MTDPIYLPKLISEQFGCSSSEARRLINQGAVKVDGEPAHDFDPPSSFLVGKTLTVGKRRSVKL